MKTKYYRCEFLSDIVLPASSNTQGNIRLSDFIAGSNFLGMVASNNGYESFKEEAFDVFHSGAVRFFDAHVEIDSKLSYKIPLSFHALKIGDKNFNRLHLDDADETRLRTNQEQLKQHRVGFINEDYSYNIPSYNYTQKSSYDQALRRSKDEGMFGYSALKKGTHWIFKVSYKDDKYIHKVEQRLLGDKKLGKSKSAQYGKVNIVNADNFDSIKTFTPEDNLSYIYLNSRAVLVDKSGNFTTLPSIENLGLSSGEIVWEKTYIKTSSYHPYNSARETKEYTRVCISKGSVITIKNLSQTPENGIGAFLSEGFGDILINPKFLESKSPQLRKYDVYRPSIASSNYDKNLIGFLEKKADNDNDTLEVSSHVQKVYKTFIQASKSQWGQIRVFATTAKDSNDLVSKITEYIEKGSSKKQWEGISDKLIKEIHASKKPLEFTKLLAMIVSKHTKGSKDA